MKIPSSPLSEAELYARIQAYRAHDLNAHGGRTWAYVYDSGRPDVAEVARAAYMMFLDENALDPTVFPSLLQMENEVVAMSAHHLNGGPDVVGNFTSGGTESCMLAVKTARDFARATRPHIQRPELILPVTAHAAFHKAAHYLDVVPVLVPVDPVTYKADVEAVRQAITPNTILIVGSAVSYAHGVIDPIEALAALAQSHDLLFHVDGCIGGFLLPYFRRLGAPVPPFDFSVPGVTSISMDLHKYAYAPKGASVVLYRNKELRQHQLFACARWTGYTIINSTIQSTKSGGPVAAAWATLQYMGDQGYLEIAERTLKATRLLLEGIQSIPGLQVLGTPESSLIAFASDELDVFELADVMRQKQWYVQPQLGHMGSKPNIHLSVTAASLERVETLLHDLREAVDVVRQGAESGASGPELGAALQQLDLANLPPEAFQGLLALAGIQNGRLPERLAGINRLLNLLSPEMNEHLLKVFVNQLFTARGE
ncbi:MAG: pyridoxal phosphate-dependent decarboxylase family protein [Myxococcota bacterium]